MLEVGNAHVYIAIGKKVSIACVISYYPVLCYKGGDKDQQVGKEKKWEIKGMFMLLNVGLNQMLRWLGIVGGGIRGMLLNTNAFILFIQ